MFPRVKPLEGRSCPVGGRNWKGFPSGKAMESVIGLNESFPEKAIAVTTVGEARKFIVLRLPSLRDLKLLLRVVSQVKNHEQGSAPVERRKNRFRRVSKCGNIVLKCTYHSLCPWHLLVSTDRKGIRNFNRQRGIAHLTNAGTASVG